MRRSLGALAAIATACLPGACGERPPAPAELPAAVAARDFDELAARIEPRERPLVVNHWATWCGPCVDELPYLAEVARRFEGRADFVGVSWDRTSEKQTIENCLASVDRVRAARGSFYPTILAPPGIGALAKALLLEAEFIPQTYVVGRDGARLRSFLGEIVEDEDRKAFEAAISDACR